jgi:protein phosphatase 1B
MDPFKPVMESFPISGGVLACGVAHMRGMRGSMEDAHTSQAIPDTPFHFLSVLDGHGGRGTATFASTQLLPCIMRTEEWVSAAAGGFCDDTLLFSSLRAGFTACDDLCYETLFPSGDTSGSTAIAALISPHCIAVANCGDSRAVLVRTSVEGGAGVVTTTTALSTDHKPDAHKERARLIPLAGAAGVSGGYFQRLAVSRTLGDFRTKLDHQCPVPSGGVGPPLLPIPRQTITSDPEVTVAVRDPRDAFLILACDGVWDVISNGEAADIVMGVMNGGEGAGPKEAAGALIHECLERGSSDNMTAIVADLRVGGGG